MSKIHQFNHFRFLPFYKRKGDIHVTNYFQTRSGEISPLYLDEVPFARFRIDKLEPNPYYGKKDQYKLDENSGFYYSQEHGVKIAPSFFENKETSYTIAYFIDVNDTEMLPNLEILSERLFGLSDTEKIIMLSLAEEAYHFICEQLSKNATEFNVY